MHTQRSHSLDPMETATTSELEKYANDLVNAIYFMQTHMRNYPENEEHNQVLRDEIAHLSTFHQTLQMILTKRCSSTTLPIRCLTTKTYFNT
jgi:hypothetical protein